MDNVLTSLWDTVSSPWAEEEVAVAVTPDDSWYNLKSTPAETVSNPDILDNQGWKPTDYNASLETPTYFGDNGYSGVGVSDFATGNFTPKEAKPKPDRFGSILESLGGQMMASSQSSGPVAPAFKPSFKQQQVQTTGSEALAQLASNPYSLSK
ncbi:MAG: hypothetical protein ACRCZ2_08760 [Fusobacteriaceae bacterium]